MIGDCCPVVHLFNFVVILFVILLGSWLFVIWLHYGWDCGRLVVGLVTHIYTHLRFTCWLLIGCDLFVVVDLVCWLLRSYVPSCWLVGLFSWMPHTRLTPCTHTFGHTPLVTHTLHTHILYTHTAFYCLLLLLPLVHVPGCWLIAELIVAGHVWFPHVWLVGLRLPHLGCCSTHIGCCWLVAWLLVAVCDFVWLCPSWTAVTPYSYIDPGEPSC